MTTPRRLTAGIAALLTAACVAGNAGAAPPSLEVARQCDKIKITVTAEQNGTHVLYGFREHGEEAGKENTWAAHQDAGEAQLWTDTSYSTVRYEAWYGYRGNPGSKLLATNRSERNC